MLKPSKEQPQRNKTVPSLEQRRKELGWGLIEAQRQAHARRIKNVK